MYLGIEIGGTKIQLGIGDGRAAKLVDLVRFDVEPGGDAQSILAGIAEHAPPLIDTHRPTAAGIGFGGPINGDATRTLKSHHVDGWDDFSLVDWVRDTLGLPSVLANDADTAALAEATFGAGRGRNPVFYITVGTGIGGGLIIDRQIYRGSGAGAAELGHLRPGFEASEADDNLEAHAAGWGIAAQCRREITADADSPNAVELLDMCDNDADMLTTKQIATAAAAGNALAQLVLDNAWTALGWGIAQMVTLLSPEVIVIGGGVSLVGEEHFFAPLRRAVRQYVFPPVAQQFEIVPAELGEEVVIHGALALARNAID